MISIKKYATLCGLALLLTSAGAAANAQGGPPPPPPPGAPMIMHHGPMMGMMHHHGRFAIMRQKRAYADAVAHGDYAAAERAHMRARMIRHHIRAHREMRMGMGNPPMH